MSQIEIQRKHQLPIDDAKARVERVAAQIANRFDIDYAWQGDTLNFQRPGVDGRIAVAAREIRVQARLGLLLFALRPAIEHEIRRVMDKEFD